MVESFGIILAGGNGTRLFPLTKVVNKHLLPVFDKPMIYYPLSTLMLAGIRDVLIIVRPQDLSLYQSLFPKPELLGINLRFLVQKEPNGIPDAYLIGKKLINNRPVTLILGDNIFLGQGLGRTLTNSIVSKGAKIFGFPVNNPQDYGVLELDQSSNKVIRVVEKPKEFIGNLAVPGLYFTDAAVGEIAYDLKKSLRGELEIADLLNVYAERNQLEAELFQRGIGWMDAGSVNSLFEAAELVQVLQKRQGLQFSSPEEIAWRNKWISDEQLIFNSQNYGATEYGNYLRSLLK